MLLSPSETDRSAASKVGFGHHSNGSTAGLDLVFRGDCSPPAQPAPLLAEMAGGIAHDFRNILAVVGSALRLAGRHSDDPNKLAGLLEAAQDCVGRGMDMTADLLAFGHRLEGEPEPLDLNAILVELQTILGLAAGPGIAVELDLEPSLPPCKFARAGFETAILNLVINARDAMPEGGRIQIATELVGESGMPWQSGRAALRVRVRDEGSGIRSDVISHIFEPRFTTKAANGTGLGLPLVCAFVSRSGGRIVVESSEGAGTTVHLLLPVHLEPAHEDAEDKGLWRQIDRWINEGGAPEGTGLASLKGRSRNANGEC